MKRRRKFIHPWNQLAIALGVAARDIAVESARREAARQAESIPVCNMERGGGRKGELARLGRKTLASLPLQSPEAFAEAAGVLRGCRDAMVGRFEETSVVKYGGRRKRETRPAV